MNMNILEQVFFGNRILDYIAAFLILIIGLLFVKLAIGSFISRLKKVAEKTANKFDDLLVKMLRKLILPLLYLTCIYIGLKTLNMPVVAHRIINITELALITILLTRLFIIFVNYSLNLYIARQRGDITLVRSLDGMLRVLKYLIWAIAFIIFLDNIGFKVSALLAGLGIGGIAVAIAAQALLKDFFSYFSIVFDRPFKLGDFIAIGDFMGTVEHIGVKTTRIRSLSGEMLIFSNTDLTDSRVRNYTSMEKKWVLFNINMTYQTPIDKLKEIPAMIETIIKNIKGAAFDRAHFSKYSEASIVFEIAYTVLSSDYKKFMDIQQEINLAIKEEFEKRKIEFAYPTRTLYLKNNLEK